MIHWYVEESLNLVGVQIHGQDPARPGGGDHVGHHLGGDRRSPLRLSILTRVAEIGYDRRNAFRAGPPQAIDENEQFH